MSDLKHRSKQELDEIISYEESQFKKRLKDINCKKSQNRGAAERIKWAKFYRDKIIVREKHLKKMKKGFRDHYGCLWPDSDSDDFIKAAANTWQDCYNFFNK